MVEDDALVKAWRAFLHDPVERNEERFLALAPGDKPGASGRDELLGHQALDRGLTPDVGGHAVARSEDAEHAPLGPAEPVDQRAPGGAVLAEAEDQCRHGEPQPLGLLTAGPNLDGAIGEARPGVEPPAAFVKEGCGVEEAIHRTSGVPEQLTTECKAGLGCVGWAKDVLGPPEPVTPIVHVCKGRGRDADAPVLACVGIPDLDPRGELTLVRPAAIDTRVGDDGSQKTGERQHVVGDLDLVIRVASLDVRLLAGSLAEEVEHRPEALQKERVTGLGDERLGRTHRDRRATDTDDHFALLGCQAREELGELVELRREKEEVGPRARGPLEGPASGIDTHLAVTRMRGGDEQVGLGAVVLRRPTGQGRELGDELERMAHLAGEAVDQQPLLFNAHHAEGVGQSEVRGDVEADESLEEFGHGNPRVGWSTVVWLVCFSAPR